MREMRPDPQKAESIVLASEREMKFTLTLAPSEAAAATIIRNVYESFRMLGDALLVKQGIKSQDHTGQINELLKLQIKTNRPIAVLENLKTLRHNINYRGYKPTVAEVNDTVDIAQEIFKPLITEVKKLIKRH
jgi:uncharacterized protein (UPF0332 family)